MERYDLLKQTYIENLLRISDQETFIRHLPNMYFPASMEILQEVLTKLEKDVNDAKNIIDSSKDVEEIDFYKNEILNIGNKINIINTQISREIEQEQIEEECLTNGMSKNIIFATTSRGIYIEEDLKDIPNEYYDKILACLHKLEQGYSEYNEEKQRKMGSVNKKIKGVQELKEFKIRLIYQILDKDTVYVMGVIFKKDDFSKKTRQSMILRKSNVEEEYKTTQNALKNEETKRKLISGNETIKQRIYEYLSSKKRGENNAQK